MCFTDAAEMHSYKKQRRRKIVTTVYQSKEDMRQWNGAKKRKWSHTFSTCPKTSHPHLPLTDHGSCCHISHARLSLQWFLRKVRLGWQTLFGLSVLFWTWEIQVIIETVPHTTHFICPVTKLARSGEICPYGRRMKLCLHTPDVLSH